MNKDTRLLLDAADNGRLVPALNALERYRRRQLRFERPDGYFDHAGRWWPNTTESQVTRYARTPSRAWPYSYLTACRTLAHCEELEDAIHEDVLALRRLLKKHPDIDVALHLAQVRSTERVHLAHHQQPTTHHPRARA